MDLSIVINNYKNPQLLRVCLDSIKECTKEFSKEKQLEIIVADSATEEETEMMMREDFSEVSFFPFKKNVGFQALVNKGIEASKGKYILLLNGDIIVTPDSIQKMFEFMQTDETIGIVGPKLLNFNGTMQPSCFRFYKPITIVYRRTVLGRLPFARKHLDWFLMKDYAHDKVKEVDWLMGSAYLISKKALDKVGLLDPQFFMYMEDVDWCRRFWENGFKVVYFPEAQMHHYHGKASAKGGVIRSLLFNRLTWVHISSAFKYFKKYYGKESPHKLK